MAATTLVKDVLWRAAVLLNDVRPQFQRWSERELVDWLNDAQMAIVKFLPAACSRIDAIRLAPGTRQSLETLAPDSVLPGDGSTLTQPIHGVQLLDVVRNMGADGRTPGQVVTSTSRRILDNVSPHWHTVMRGVVDNYLYDPQTPRYFYVTPGVPPADGGRVWVEVAYTAQPLRIDNSAPAGSEQYRADGASTATLTISDEFLDDLVNYVVARANMKDTEWADGNKAAAFSQMFVSSLNAKVAAITGSSPNLQRLPFAPTPLGQAK